MKDNSKYDNPQIYEIFDIIEENEFVKTFWLKPYFSNAKSEMIENSKPGQYVMVWLPDLFKELKKYYEPAFEILDQIPMSISDKKKDKIAITVKKLGSSTIELHKYSINRKLGILGPLGTSFNIKGKKILVVAGGMGIAPLRFLIKSLNNNNISFSLLYGAKSSDELIFINQIEQFCQSCIITTDDGSYGKKGFVTDYLTDAYIDFKPDQIISCGPEIMMKAVLDFSLKNNIYSEFSLERFMYCGMGVCGFCSLNGLRVCKEGPVFNSNVLKNNKEFGNMWIDGKGIRREI